MKSVGLSGLMWATVAVVVAALVVAELAMDMSSDDRRLLYLVFAGMAALTALAAVAALRWAPRLSSLLNSLRIVALSAVIVAGGAVAAAALTMFIEPHDLTLVLVALLLGVGLGGVLAVAVAGPLTNDLKRLADAAQAVGAGDFTVASGIRRNDELGMAAGAFDEMARRLKQAEATARANEQERRHFMASVGHDLRTPLASLQASIEALQDGMVDQPDRHLRGMSSDVAQLRRLVDDVFLLSRLDAGSYPIHLEPIDLTELADEAAEAMTPLAMSAGVRLRLDGFGSVPAVVDPAAVGRILRNLVDNAIRHSPADSTVRIATRQSSNRVEIVVEDSGPGFPDEFRPMAFERFTRADAARRREDGGAGLGLAIALELARLLGGDLTLLEGPGGRLRLSFPGR